MLYHNIVNGKESRLARIIWSQQHNYDMPNTFDSILKKICSILELKRDPVNMMHILKSNWKEEIKTSLSKYTAKKFQPLLESMTKLRFLKNDSFKRKPYIEKLPSYQACQITEIRLNMRKMKQNFRTRFENPLCRLCKKEKESTKHVFLCPSILTQQIDPVNLEETEQLKDKAKNIFSCILS